MGQLDGRVMIVSGATSGMGNAMAAKFAREGARLVLNGRNEERAKMVLQELQPYRRNITFVSGDVSRPAVNRELVERALSEYGKLDTIVTNAGRLGLGDVVALPEEEWRLTLDTNLSSLFYLAKYAVPHLQESGCGVILSNASIAAFKAFPKHPAYCASKAGQVALIRQLAVEYGPVVRANAICPGPVNTPLIWGSTLAFDRPEEAVENARKATLMKRLGRPTDIADLALFLVSEASSWITGSAITIDGGISVC
jgi:NAD(P)-dependent dehydrogenase (short-subunit alcohol dehydrogenase family)